MRKRNTFQYGMVAEFDTPEAIISATELAREKGYTAIECYTPFPVHGLSEAMNFRDERLPWIFFLCGLTGALSGLALETYTAVFDYPLNVGGKPLFSLPSFFPVLYECTILFAALGGTISMLALNGLPRPYHPIFSAPGFERASQDRFFLCIEATDAQFDNEKTRKFLESLKPFSVSSVEDEE